MLRRDWMGVMLAAAIVLSLLSTRLQTLEAECTQEPLLLHNSGGAGLTMLANKEQRQAEPLAHREIEVLNLSPHEQINLTINLLASCLMMGDERGLRQILSPDCDFLDEFGSGGFLVGVQGLAETVGKASGRIHIAIVETSHKIGDNRATVYCRVEVSTAETDNYETIAKRQGVIELIRDGARWRVSGGSLLPCIVRDIARYTKS